MKRPKRNRLKNAMTRAEVEKKYGPRQGQVTMPPQYWQAIDKRVREEKAKGRAASRSSIIRLALDLMEW
jgi:hypothetical protein